MKSFAKIVLFLFCVFLVTPTVVSVIKNSTDTSYFYTLNEEERTPSNPIQEEEHKIIPTFCCQQSFLVITIEKRNNFSIIENLSYKLLATSLNLPPPELV